MTAVDHKAAAVAILAPDYADPRNPPHAAGQEALVHATLYLAEQQRIANLIAWIGDGLLSCDPNKREEQLALQREVAKGLGL